MYLRPSEVFYSQDSINNVFDKRCSHAYKPIGETLDEICEGRCLVNSIPTISVVEKDGKWITSDNRRLWVFRQLERLGKCEKIRVQLGCYIPTGKHTSYNGGVSVRVRGSPGGYWHFKPSVNTFNQFGETLNLYQGGFDSYGRNTGIRLNENMLSGVTSYTGGSSPSFSYSGRVSVNHSKTRTESEPYGTLANKRNDEFTSMYVPQQRVYPHETYDRSYNGDERLHGNVASHSGREKDNSWCIII